MCLAIARKYSTENEFMTVFSYCVTLASRIQGSKTGIGADMVSTFGGQVPRLSPLQNARMLGEAGTLNVGAGHLSCMDYQLNIMFYIVHLVTG